MGMSLSPELLEDCIRRGLLTREQVYGERAAPVENGRHAQSAQNTGESAITLPKQAKRAPCSTAPCQSLWIPNWTPGLLNQWDGHHWSKRAKIKKADQNIVATYFSVTGISKATGPRRVSMVFILPKGKRMFDRDAPWKSAKDALAACGALLDDTPRLCIDGPVSYARAIGAESAIGTLILMEDL